MVAETAWIAQAARDIRSNQLRIGAPLYTMLIPERRRFLDRLAVEHPELRLRIFDRAPAKYYADLARGEIDLAILLEPSRPRGHDSEGRFDGDWPDGFERCRLGERRLGLLVPAEHPWAAMDEVPRAALKGSPIDTINRSQGVPLSEAVGWALGEPGATPVRPPEGNAIGAERHGRLTRTPAVTLGWFDYPDRPDGSDMVVRFVAGLTLSTSLVVIRTRGEKRPAAARFWELALAAAAEGEKIFLSSVRNVGI
jgi:DNA-binding transcriptional LysR family regulator